MKAKDILDILKDTLEASIEDSQVIKEDLNAQLFKSSKDYLNGYHDAVIHTCDDLLDLINLLKK